MKKLLLLSAALLIGLSSCTKDEVSPTPDQKITFSAPVVSPSTKTIIEGTTYPESETFGVYAWYSPSGTLGTANETPTTYMNKVEVKHNSALKDNVDETTEKGGWEPATAYYWPKTGSLTFDAFSPYSINSYLSATSADGIEIKDYVVAADAQVDVLYSDRALNKTTSSDNAAGVATSIYDGVDIKFHHALSAVYITAKTDAKYERDIKIKSLKITSAHNKATFSQNESNATAKNSWGTTSFSDAQSPVEYTYVSTSTVVPYVDGTDVTKPLDCGYKILLPQQFADSKATIEIVYSIAYGTDSELDQSIEFDLSNNYTDTDNNKISEWKQGDKYTYNLVFGLQKIFFEPTVTDWVPVVVSDLTI